MDQKKKLIILGFSMIFALLFWRMIVFLRKGQISVLRGLTGFNIHHYHYGIFMVLIACLIFIFYKVEKYSIILMGLGFGSYFDGFISRLLANPLRVIEITNYNNAFFLTIFLFINLTLFSIDFYLLFEGEKFNLKNEKVIKT